MMPSVTQQTNSLASTEGPEEFSCNLQMKSGDGNLDIYSGIPVNLLLNFGVWLLLLILFTFLRRLAWDYGHIALVSRSEEKHPIQTDENQYNVWTSLFYGDREHNLSGSNESLDSSIHKQDRGFCSWIPAFIRVKDTDILRKSGRDAVQYLSFQRYLLVYMCIICILSTAVILPVNFQGDLEGNATDFGHTTIGNVDPKSSVLWIHVCMGLVYLLIAIFFMQHFSQNLEFDEDDQVTRTLMISNIPKDKCLNTLLQQHFQESYPEYVVTDIQFAYDIERLVFLDKARRRALEARINSEQEYRVSNARPLIYPVHCGQCCCCCCNSCSCKQVDAIDYYSEKELRLHDACEKEKVTAYQSPLGIAFVTCATYIMAERVYRDFKASCKGVQNPSPSSVSEQLAVQEWEVAYAPSPQNIHWGNLSISAWKWWLKAIIINVLLLILLFFLTTPSIIMNVLDKIQYKRALEDLNSPLLVQFLPTLLLWLFSALLPTLVFYSDQYVGYWTRTVQHHIMMRKIFIFLVLMVFVLPSLGLTSAKALFEWAVRDANHRYRWKCIFLSGNGAFFVNYVITSAFIGTGMELMRFSELFIYCIKIFWARSSAERTAVRKAVVWEFQFGVQYAWMLCIFAVILAYSIPCPLVTPFGLLYLVLKHLVDRYNIYFAYGPSRIDKNIHATAITFVITSVIFLQVAILFFTALRSEEVQPTFVFSAIALFITLIIFFGRMCFGWFKGLSSIQYKPTEDIDADDSSTQHLTADIQEPTKPFVANVLLDNTSSSPEDSSDRPYISSYGAVSK